MDWAVRNMEPRTVNTIRVGAVRRQMTVAQYLTHLVSLANEPDDPTARLAAALSDSTEDTITVSPHDFDADYRAEPA